MLLPEGLDSVVGFFPVRDGRPPVAEDRGCLRRCALVARRLEGFADGRRQRIGLDVCGAGYAKPEAAQVVILVVVAVPAAVILREAEFELRAALKLQRLLEVENGLPRYIAATGTDVD